MKQADRARLTAALREHVAAIAADLRARMREPGPTRERARQLHTDERVGEDFDVWTDLLSRRAAVLWVLKSVYVRVLEDRGLLAPGRLLDPEAQQLFERLAPNLGETAFLGWIYHDLASPNGGLPELFSVQPAELALPSDERSRALIAFWRHRDADTAAQWSFAEERFEGELMGDLYQELDPVVKDRFALCQTPDFVRSFILDRTLTPAIETFGADQVRLLDPACGSGHFLIDGLKRIFEATAVQHKDWSREQLALHALGRVVGMDLNDYACALARARLVMTAAELAGVTALADAAKFHPHVYWADGLEQVERDESKPSEQFGLFESAKSAEKPRPTFTRADVRAALRPVLTAKFHAVVANPPYITERDPASKAYHREKIGKAQRYVSAYREYSLGSPFTERSFQLAEKEGFVGIITSNNFMKREFGEPLIEKILSNLDLTLVVDTSQAFIPGHGTPTVLLFARNSRAFGEDVRVVMSKRGESGIPAEPAKALVWSSIEEGWCRVGFENDFVSVSAVPRATLSKHPWSLGGGGAAELKVRIESRSLGRLADQVESIGYMCITKQDEVFVQEFSTFERHGCDSSWLKLFGNGDMLRDWTIIGGPAVIFPYNDDLELRPLPENTGVERFLWRFRRLLEERAVFGGDTFRTAGRPWWDHGQITKERFRTPLAIAFAFIATHNHFILDRGGKAFNRSAPVIKLPRAATEAEYYSALGVLNSSAGCFWMKQVFHNKGGGTSAGKWQSDAAKIAYDFTVTGLQEFPFPDVGPCREVLLECARRLDKLAAERAGVLIAALPDIRTLEPFPSHEIRALLEEAESRESQILRQQIVLQEEIDWSVYHLYGLVENLPRISPDHIERTSGAPLGARPFEVLQARSGRAYGVDGQLLMKDLPSDLDERIAKVWTERMLAVERSPALALIEHESYKRRWLLTPKHLAGRVETFADRLGDRLRLLLSDLVEFAARKRNVPFDLGRIAADLQEEPRFSMLAELMTARCDYSHDRLVLELLTDDAVPNHPFHRYSKSGLVKHQAWEQTWEDQRREDAGERVTPAVPPTYAQPDFNTRRIFELRGKLDVPRERYIAFTEVHGSTDAGTLYGWAGWTPLQRLKAILAIDEDREDAGVSLADRIALLDSAWRLLPEVAREDGQAAARLKAELQALVGPTGPSREMLEDWRKRFPPPKPPKKTVARARKAKQDEEDDA
ncbi:BREX-2 system adenine-specific DNA-methyltransferase PglX [Nannocystis bainbridge]|uniref:site-specific DNA-methyltransferase (adenine-specific) n=1 Tax=Nannocystis bainbridge TaxID=2995303 RepID=A0ABT5EA89_9BACT|nr:BREX-2 system adenine-specific DNA-methyltransferase PglX [Nannocystis bainbridge]MDC0721696.1 BREX-2 system adenine-specific DNA-methyltransferase PglX [Nannocystis bainbridge]